MSDSSVWVIRDHLGKDNSMGDEKYGLVGSS